jgi:hypothetical protein
MKLHLLTLYSFQSDHDLDLVLDLSAEAGLLELEKRDIAAVKLAGKKAKTWLEKSDDEDKMETETFRYSIYGPECSHPEAVKKYLDAGTLDELFEKKLEAMAKAGKEDKGYYGPGEYSVYACRLSESVTDASRLRLRSPRCMCHVSRLQASSTHSPAPQETLHSR